MTTGPSSFRLDTGLGGVGGGGGGEGVSPPLRPTYINKTLFNIQLEKLRE